MVQGKVFNNCENIMKNLHNTQFKFKKIRLFFYLHFYLAFLNLCIKG